MTNVWKRAGALVGLLMLVATPFLQAQPRLVVGIVVDQMRWDYLERYQDRYGKDGLNRLMREGYNCTQCMINYLPAVTAVGHASVYTGTVPAYHGIVSNHFMDGATECYCTADTTVESVGTRSATGQHSPHRLLSTTMTDQLRLATNFRGKTIGVALKDRAAILPVGHTATAAYWLGDDDRFVSSTYYIKELPEWVQHFNERGLPAQYMQRGWPRQLMYPDSTYRQSHERDTLIEHPVGGGIRTTPWGATLTLEMAKAAIEGEALGKDDDTDFLTVSISSTDAIAHRTGPNSSYVEDAYLWLDRDLADFFRYLDQQVGKNRWTVFLTADHAGQHAPEFRRRHRLPAAVWESRGVMETLNHVVSDRLGVPGHYVTGINNFCLRIDEEAVLRCGGNATEVIDTVCRRLRVMPEVAYAFDVRRMPTFLPDPLPEMVRNGWRADRCGQVMIIPQPGVMEAYSYGEGNNLRGASHALWTPDDTHIPCLFMGWGVPRGVRDNHRVRIVDIAATVCSLLHIQQPNACVGEPIF